MQEGRSAIIDRAMHARSVEKGGPSEMRAIIIRSVVRPLNHRVGHLEIPSQLDGTWIANPLKQ